MKAVAALTFGPPENYEVVDVPVPDPGPGQIQVRIAAASLNPGDVRVPSGAYQLPLDFPHVVGNDFAGTVSALGSGVTAYRVGDEIFGHAIPRVLRAMASPTRPSLSTGSLAEYAVFEADTPLIAHRPDGLDIEQAAAVPTVGLTTLALLGVAGIRSGETALVVGATGGVGTTFVPLLARAGARVIATTTAADAELLHELGADETIAYGDYPAHVDVAFNLTLPGDQLEPLARTSGRLYTITEPAEVGRFVLDLDATHGGMREVGELVRATISRRYPLDDGPKACTDFLRAHTTGKLVVTI